MERRDLFLKRKGNKYVDTREAKVDRLAGHIVRTATQSSIEVKQSYNADDIKHLSYEGDFRDPGTYPFTRGLYSEMYRNRLWPKSFIVRYATPEKTNLVDSIMKN